MSEIQTIKQISFENQQSLFKRALSVPLPNNKLFLKTFLDRECKKISGWGQEDVIYSTKNYSSFSLLLGNREIREEHVVELIKSFKTNGYLKTILIVNEKLELIDGQHRFEAARRCGLPVYFQIQPGWGIDQVTTLNVITRNWKLEDYLKSYSERGNQNYQRIQDFLKETDHDYDLTTIMIMIKNKSSKEGSLNTSFKQGTWVVEEDHIASAKKLSKKIQEIGLFHPKGRFKCTFVMAVQKLFAITNYDHKHMIKNLNDYPNIMLLKGRSITLEGYMDIFISIYNYYVKDQKKIIFVSSDERR